MLHNSLYVSSTAGLSFKEVDAILTTAIAFNSNHDITGFLLYDGQYFVQYLEGPKEHLDYLLAKIAKDPRHSCFTMLEFQECERRVCPDWKMKLLLVDRSAEFLGLPDKLNSYQKKLIANIFTLNSPYSVKG